MPKLSIIIPSYYEENGIELFLSCLCGRVTGIDKVEILVVDSSDDQTKAKAELFALNNPSVNIQALSSPKGRALQMNVGARYALDLNKRGCSEGESEGNNDHYVLFLHADTLLPVDFPLWWQQVCAIKPKWGFFSVRLTSEKWPFRVIEKMMNWRSRLTLIGTGDQCLFVRSDIWCETEGFKHINLMEDVEFCKRLRNVSRPYIHQNPVNTSSRRWEDNGIARTVLLMWVLRIGYFCGLNPKKLACWYRSS